MTSLLKKWALTAAISIVVIIPSLACAESDPGQGTGFTTETRSVEDSLPDTGKLLTDATAALESMAVQNLGVAFEMQSTSISRNGQVVSAGKGDMLFPDRMKMRMTQTLLGGQPIEMELVLVSGSVYIKSQPTGGIWRTSSGGFIPPDPASIKGYIDFARSSRNFGQESLRGGRKTIHVQLDVDMVLAAEEAKKRTVDPALQQAIEASKSSLVTVDLWIGIDDSLIYQQKTRVTDTSLGSDSESSFTFSDWGKTVQIEQPCDAC